MPSANQYDLAVIGGGPAGAAAAITAARAGASVVMFEAKSYPRHKVCGEFVSAESLDLLADLLRESQVSLVDAAPVLMRARLFLGSRVIEAAISPAAVSIARHDLDAVLWNVAAEAGVETHSHCEAHSVEGDGPFRVDTTLGSFEVKAVVVAAGRWSQFTADRAVPLGPKWIGVKAHFRETNPSPSTDLYFFDKGYCGVQSVGPGIVNACAMIRSDCATSLADVVALHGKLSKRADGWTPATQPVSTAPLIYRQPQPTRGNVIFAGDAAAFIDPFVGDGISIALRSGRTAAECLGNLWSRRVGLSDATKLYEQEYSRQFAPLLTAAARVRSLLSLPVAARALAFELLRIPGLLPLIVRKTRRAS